MDSEKKMLTGNYAAAYGAKLARVRVVPVYPITPQTTVIEKLIEFISKNEMQAEYIPIESEHSAMAAAIGAQATGVRAFTASSSQGIAYMHENLWVASGLRLPMVMVMVNRTMNPPIAGAPDLSDSLSQRDTGWIQLYCEDGQEVLDTTLQAFRLAESVNLPVMVVLDAFFLSHTYEPVEVPDQEQVDQFLPPLSPRIQLDTANPFAIYQMVAPSAYMEMRYNIQVAMEQVTSRFSEIEDEFETIFGRKHGLLEAIQCEDAEIILATAGTTASTCRHVIADLRKKGEKAGLLKFKMFRPYPTDQIRRHLGQAQKVAVIDRNFSFGASGIFAQEIKSALCNTDVRPPVFGYVAGLGGRDVTPQTLEEIYWQTKNNNIPKDESVWIGLNQELVESWSN